MATSKETKSSMFLAFSIFILPLVKCQGPHPTPGGLNFGGREAVGNVFHPQGGIISGGRDINYGLAIGTGINSGRAGSGPTGHFGNVAAADNALATPGMRFATGNGINYGLGERGLGTGISVGAELVPHGPFGSSTTIENAIDMPYANVGNSPGIDHTLNGRGPGPGTRFGVVGGSPLGIFRGSTQVEQTINKADASVGRGQGPGIGFGVGGSDPRGSSGSVFNMPSARSSDSYGMNYDLERREESLIGVSGSGHQGNFDLGGNRNPVNSGHLPGHTNDNGYAITSSTGHEPDKVYLVYEKDKTIGESNVVGRSQHINKEKGSSYVDSYGGLGGNQVKSDLNLNNYRYQTRSDDAIGSDYIDDVGSEFGYQGGDTATGQYDEGYTNEFELGVENEVYESIPQYSDEGGERELGFDYNMEEDENDYSYETVYEDIEGVDDWVEDDAEQSDAKYGYGLYDPYDYSSSTEDYDIKTIYIDLKDGESIPTHYSEENLVDSSYSNHSNSFSGYQDQMHDNGGSRDDRTDDNRSENGYENGRRSTDDNFYDDDDDDYYENITERGEHGGRRGQGNGHGHGDLREYDDRTERRSNSHSDRREYDREGYDHFSDDDRRRHHHGHDTARAYSAQESSGLEHRHESTREHSEHHGRTGYSHGSTREHSRNTEIIGHGRDDTEGHDRKGRDHFSDSRREHDEDDDRRRQRHGHSSTREDDEREERTGYGQSHGGLREQSGHDERRGNGHGHGGMRKDREHAMRRDHSRSGRREHDRRGHGYGQDSTREYDDDDNDDRRGHRRGHDSARKYSERKRSGQGHGHGSTREHSEHHGRRGHISIREQREHTLGIGHGRGDRREHDRRRHDHDQDNRRENDEDYDRRRYRHGHDSPREDDYREERTGYGKSHGGIREQSGHNERRENSHGHVGTRERSEHAERRGHGRGDRREHDRTGHGHDQESTREYGDGNRREHRHGHDSAREYSQRERSGQGHSHGSTIEHENRREFGHGHGGFREYRERVERRGHGGRGEHDRGGRHSHFRDSPRDDSDDRTSHSQGVSREYHGHDEERVHGPGGRRDNDHRRSLNIGHVGAAEHDERTYTRRHDHGHNSTRNFRQDDRRGHGHNYHTQGHSGLSQHDDREYRIRHGHNLGDNIAQRHGHFEGNSHDRGRSSPGHGRRREQYARDDRRENGNVNGDIEIYSDNAYRERQSQSHSRVNHEYGDRRETGRGIVDTGPIVRSRGRHRNFHRELHNSGSSHEGRRERIDHENFRGRGHDANGRRRVAENSRGVHIQGLGDRNSDHVEQNRVRGSFHRDQNAIRFSAYARQKHTNTGDHYNRENPSQLQHKRKDSERKKQVTSTKQHKKPAPRRKLMKVDGNVRHPIRRGDRRPEKKTYPRRRLIKIVKIRRRPLLKKYNSRKTKRIQQRPRKYIARSQRKKPFIYRPRPTMKKRPKPLYYQKFGQYLKKYRLRPASRQKPGQRYNQKRLIPRKMKRHKDNPKQQKGQSRPHYYFNSKSKHLASGLGKTEAPKIHEQKSLHTHIMPHPNRYLYTHIPPYRQFSNINFR